MYAEIISIGTEITTGSTLNTNVQYISEKLLDLGIETLYHTTVDDNSERLKDVIKIALNRVDLIITTGGLGPTEDDLTKEVFSEVLNLELIEDPLMIETIQSKFNLYNNNNGRKEIMTKNNLKQAIKIKDSSFLTNHIGTAPGTYLSKDDKKIILLPGPPEEMKTMFNREVEPLIKKDYYIIKRSINLSDIGESAVEMQIKDLLNNYKNIYIATFAKVGEVEIKIIGRGKNKVELEKNINNIIQILEERFKRNIYGFDNVPIEKIVFDLLNERQYKIGFCESCTGGLISGAFSRLAGASKVLDRSIVTYSNQSKIEEVKVKPETLKEFTDVSKEVALEMAEGMLTKGNLDIALSVTGMAGPATDSDINPLGLVYIGIVSKKSYNIIKLKLTGNRESIQNKVVNRSFLELKNFLLNYPI